MTKKLSVWSIIILVATIISLILLVTSITVTSLGIPAAMEVARQAAKDAGVPAAEQELAATIAVGAIVAALAFSAAFDVLKIVGGFLFSLKNRWGIFCIVVSIISIATTVWSLVADISNKAGAGSIVIDSIALAVGALLVFANFKHYGEIKAGA